METSQDPLNFLTLERTFCSLCYSDGKRPVDMPDAVLGGVRFERYALMRGAALARYRRKTRYRVLAHMVRYHHELASRLYPNYTKAHARAA